MSAWRPESSWHLHAPLQILAQRIPIMTVKHGLSGPCLWFDRWACKHNVYMGLTPEPIGGTALGHLINDDLVSKSSTCCSDLSIKNEAQTQLPRQLNSQFSHWQPETSKETFDTNRHSDYLQDTWPRMKKNKDNLEVRHWGNTAKGMG